jgi:hypothetical protein
MEQLLLRNKLLQSCSLSTTAIHAMGNKIMMERYCIVTSSWGGNFVRSASTRAGERMALKERAVFRKAV